MSAEIRDYFKQRIAEVHVKAAADIAADIDYLRGLKFYQLQSELPHWGMLKLRAIAKALALPTEYDDGKMKPKAVLVAAVYEGIRLAKEQPEPPERKGCQRCKWCLGKHPFGCPHTADQSQIQAVTAMAE